MSMIMLLKAYNGIVMASDSRVSALNEKTGFYEPKPECLAYKIILCPNNIGISACGTGGYNERDMYLCLKDIARTKINSTIDINEVPNILTDYFSKPDDEEFLVNFLVGGMDKSSNYVAYSVEMEKGKEPHIEKIEHCCICGVPDPIKNIILNTEIDVSQFQLHEAVDFCKFAIDTTTKILKFQYAAETVGGPIDILVINAFEPAYWAQRKVLN